MHLICLKDDLTKAASKANRAVSPKPNLPILSNILLTADSNGLIISSTDLETSIQIKIEAQVKNAGNIAVPARPFQEFISSLPEEKLELRVENNRIHVKGTASQAKMVTMSGEDFPPFPVSEEKEGFKIKREVFAKLIKKVAFAAATDGGKPVLTGVLMRFTPEKVILVATDGFRLSEVKSEEIVIGVGKEEKIIIPASALVEVEKFLYEDAKEEFVLSLTPQKNQILFNFDSAILATRLLEAEYPDYEKIIPTDFATKAELGVADFTQFVKISSIFARSNGQTIKLDFDPQKNRLKISSSSIQIGEQEGEISGKIEGSPLEIAFNARFLQEGLSALETEEVRFLAKDSSSPIVLKPMDESEVSFQHIIMPIRLEAQGSEQE